MQLQALEQYFSLELDLVSRSTHPGYARSLLAIRYTRHAVQRMLQRGLQLVDVLETIVKAYPDLQRVSVPEAYTCYFGGMEVPSVRVHGFILFITVYSGPRPHYRIDVPAHLNLPREDLENMVLHELVAGTRVPTRAGIVQTMSCLRLPMSGCAAQTSLREHDRPLLPRSFRKAPINPCVEYWLASLATPSLGQPPARKPPVPPPLPPRPTLPPPPVPAAEPEFVWV